MKLRKNLKQSGISLIETLIVGAALIGTSAVVVKTFQKSRQSTETVKQKEKITTLNMEFANKIKLLFSETKDAGGKRTQGLCKYIGNHASTGKIGGVYISLPSYDDEIFDKSRWDKVFPEFVPVSNERCNFPASNSYRKCFTVNPDLEKFGNISQQELQKLDISIGISINSVFTNPIYSKPFSVFSPETGKKYDVKSVGFEYSIFFLHKRDDKIEEKVSSKIFRGFYWAGELDECLKNNKRLSLTGTGFGSSQGDYIYNASGFSKDSVSSNKLAPLTINEIKSQVQSGLIKRVESTGGRYLTSNRRTLVYSSCNERKFVCPQLKQDSQRVYQFMNHLMQVKYNRDNHILPGAVSVKVAPKISFVNSHSGAVISENNNMDVEFKMVDKVYKPITEEDEYLPGENKRNLPPEYFMVNDKGLVPNKKSERIPLRVRGEHQFQFRVQDKNNRNRANNSCRQICVANTNYNSSGTNGTFKPMMSYETIKADDEVVTEVLSGAPVACTACYMKGCARIGLATFGPMQNAPTEPLDASIPECVVHENVNKGSHLEVSEQLGSLAPNSCVSMKLGESESQTPRYYASSCGVQKPVMCFNYGAHFLAKDISISNRNYNNITASLVKVPYDSGNVKCFETSRELLEVSAITKLFQQQQFDLNAINKPDHPRDFEYFASLLLEKFKSRSNLFAEEGISPLGPSLQRQLGRNVTAIYNLAKQGTFLAPIGYNQIKTALNNSENTNSGDRTLLTNRDFWVGLKTDSRGDIYAPGPVANLDNEGWALYYNQSSILHVNKYKINTEFNDEVEEGETLIKRGLLFNNIKYRGLAFKNSIAPLGDSVRLSFQCRKKRYPFDVFISNAKSKKFENGYQICKSEGGIFYPPTTTLGWIKAMLITSPHASDKAYPSFEGSELPVWVALDQNSKVVLANKYKDYFTDPDEVNESFKRTSYISTKLGGGKYGQFIFAPENKKEDEGDKGALAEATEAIEEELEEFISESLKKKSKSLCYSSRKRLFRIQSRCDFEYKYLSRGELLDIVTKDNFVAKLSLISELTSYSKFSLKVLED